MSEKWKSRFSTLCKLAVQALLILLAIFAGMYIFAGLIFEAPSWT